MYTDIVVPSGNEKEFIEMANSLGYSAICFLYSTKSEEVKSKDLSVYTGILAEEGEVKNAKKNSDFVIVKNPKDPRLCVEKESPDIIFNLEMNARKDFIHQRNSGVDHIILKYMKKKGVLFGFSLQGIFEQKEKDIFLGRVMQNISIVVKYNTDFIIASFAKHPYEMRNPEDIASLFSSLGMDKRKAKTAMQKVPVVFEKNKKIRSGLLGEGVEILRD